MGGDVKLVALWGLALAFLLAGFVVSGRALAGQRQVRRALADRRGEWAEVRALGNELDRIRAARQRYEWAEGALGAGLRDRLGAAFPGLAAGEGGVSRTELGGGLVLVENHVRLDGVELARVRDFVRAAESGTPAWRVTGLDINAAGAESGKADVRLVLASLAKK